MPSIEKHLQSSLERTGNGFREVHEWLDSKKLSLKERLKRHDISLIDEHLPGIRKKFGRKAAKEFLWHLNQANFTYFNKWFE